MSKTYFYIPFASYTNVESLKSDFPRGKIIKERKGTTVRVNTLEETKPYCYTQARNFKEFKQKSGD